MIGSIKRRFKTQKAFRVLHERQKMIVVTFSPYFPPFSATKLKIKRIWA